MHKQTAARTERTGRRLRTRVMVTIMTAAALVVTMAVPSVASAVTTPTSHSVPAPKFGKPVKTHHAPSRPKAGAPKSSITAPAVRGTAITATTATVDTPKSITHPRIETKSTHKGQSGALVTGNWNRVGASGLAVAAAGKSPTSSVTLSVNSEPATGNGHQTGLTFTIKRADADTSTSPVAVKIPISALRADFGADYATRINWVQTPIETGSKTAASTPVASTFDTASASVVLTPMVTTDAVTVMATSTPVSANGTRSFAATPLSSASTWDVSPQTGDFSWQYAMRTPPAAAGPAPSLALSYDAQSVDGESGSTNNQPSAVGDGWSHTAGGFIERRYVSCSLDDSPVTTSGDLCWKSDNAVISVAGHSGLLVKDKTSGSWKLQSDDGSKFEHLVGASAGCGAANGTYDNDCWRMTTRDGTKYYFGMNELPGWVSGNPTTKSAWTVPVFGNDSGEPCHASTFASSSCVQAWRWNLDYVVDVHGNAEALYYDSETNKYSRNGSTVVTYTRGGQLDHIDYGLTSSTIYTANSADDKVLFGYDTYGRCSDAAHTNCTSEKITSAAVAPAHPTYYPDVPFDQLCTGTTCTEKSPSFFTDGMLDTITTQALISGAYQTVDTWTLSHSFPAPGDGTNAALWLTQVVHKGSAAGQTSISEPATTFSGSTMQNRVWVKNGLAPLSKWRVTGIKTSLGAVISVNYSAQQCTAAAAPTIEASPWSNTNWCFPEWWTPGVLGAQTPQEDLFHKYVVTSVIANPSTGGGLDQLRETDYVYGTPRWRYDNSPFTPTKQRTWNQYAGVDTLQVRVGDHNAPSKQQVTADTFYQGMDGDRAGTSGGAKSVNVNGTSIADSLWFAGQLYEQKTLLGVGGAIVSDTINTPWASAVTSTDGTNSARMTNVQDTILTEPVSTGGNRTTETKTTFDASYGLPLTASTLHSDAADTCATTTYASANTSAWLVGLPAEVKTLGVDCGSVASAQYPKDLISDTRTYYDGPTLGTVGSHGDVTSTAEIDSYTGSTANWVTTSTNTYDGLGRTTSVKDVLGHTTTTAYTPSTSGPLMSEDVTNTLGWKTTTAFDPAWGVETTVTDQNSHVTMATYDALGRRIQVWLPQHTQAANPTSPSMSYAYTESQTAANAVRTTTLGSGGNDVAYALYDGLGQPIQTQAIADGGGTIVTSTGYDSAGRANWKDNAYWTTSVNPSAILAVPASETAIPSQMRTTYDAAGRVVASATWETGSERFETDNAYNGSDRVDTTPPTGGTATSVFTNSAGSKTKLVQYPGSTISGSGQSTTYAYDVAGRMTGMADPAGNDWSWDYDVLGHEVMAKDPDTGTTSSTYDDAGNLLSTTDARGQQLTYTYDALNRKTAEYSGTTAGSLLDSWTYDVTTGNLTSSSSYTGSTPGTRGLAYTTTVDAYDAADQPTSTTVSIPTGAPAFGGTTYTVKYSRGPDEAVVTQTDPGAGGLTPELIRTGYTTDGRWTSIGTSALGVTFQYTPIRQLGTINRFVPPPDSQPAQYSAYSALGYDNATGSLMSIADNATFAGTGHWIAQRSYTQNDAGGVTSATTTANYPSTVSQVDCYSYDGFGELTQVFTPGSGSTCATTPSTSMLGGAAPLWDTYTYDTKTGNRTGETVHATMPSGADSTGTYAYPAAGQPSPHAVATVSGVGAPGAGSYGYDAMGNTTTAPGQKLNYNEQGRLSAITVQSGIQKDLYNASGTLLLQTDADGGATLYLGDTVMRQTGSGPVSAVRTYADQAGTPVVEREASAGSSTTMTWLFTDVDGSVDAQTDSTAGTTNKVWRDPFGNPASGSGLWSDGKGYLNRPGSAATGLTSLGARFYDSAIGRFVSVDPVLETGDPQQTSGYAYANNNPVTLTDPTGLDPLMKQCVGKTRDCQSYYYGGSWTQSTSKPSVSQHSASWVEPSLNITAAKACDWETTCMGQQPNRYQAGKGYNPAPGSLVDRCHDWSGCAKDAGKAAVTVAFGLSLLLGVGDAVDFGAMIAAKFASRGVAGGIAAGDGALSTVPEITARLSDHVAAARTAYADGIIKMSRAQRVRAGISPQLAPAFRGQVIDKAVKASVADDAALQDIWITPQGLYGPDFMDFSTRTWWDVTTEGQFQAHLDAYSGLGAGIGLFTH